MYSCFLKKGESVMEAIPDLIGMIGVVLTLAAYLLLQISLLKIEGIAYSAINALGSLLILYSLIFHWNLSCFVIEASWLVISLFGTIKVLMRKKSQRMG
jgi:hypothetical protein